MTLRAVEIDGKPWFVAADVCAGLLIANVSQAKERLDADEKGLCTVDTPGGPQEMAIISEPGLYKLIGTSRKPATYHRGRQGFTMSKAILHKRGWRFRILQWLPYLSLITTTMAS